MIYKQPARSFLATLLLTACGLCTPSCQKAPVNGHLDGQWQVMEISPAPSDPSQARMYYCFSLHTVQLSYSDLPAWTSGNMTFSGSRLALEFPYAEGDVSRARLRQFGIGANPVVFEVPLLTSRRLTLQKGDTVITLRKF